MAISTRLSLSLSFTELSRSSPEGWSQKLSEHRSGLCSLPKTTLLPVKTKQRKSCLGKQCMNVFTKFRSFRKKKQMKKVITYVISRGITPTLRTMDGAYWNCRHTCDSLPASKNEAAGKDPMHDRNKNITLSGDVQHTTREGGKKEGETKAPTARCQKADVRWRSTLHIYLRAIFVLCLITKVYIPIVSAAK